MVVHPVNGVVSSTAPLRPASTTFSLAARMKRGGGARRALSNLGNNDAQNNLRLAESLLTVSQEKFAQKWNFDPVKAVPLAPGRYLWSPVTSSNNMTQQSPAMKSKDILTCFTLPKSGFTHHSEEEPRVPELHGVAEVEGVVNQEASTCSSENDSVMDSSSSSMISVEDNNDSGIVADESISESPVPARSPTTTQTTITDYLRCSKKRLLVVEDDEVTTLLLPASKRQQHHEGGCCPPSPAHTTTSTTSIAAAATSVPAEAAAASALHK